MTAVYQPADLTLACHSPDSLLPVLSCPLSSSCPANLQHIRLLIPCPEIIPTSKYLPAPSTKI